jgi:hypothetical protein
LEGTLENVKKMNNENNEPTIAEQEQDKGGRPSKYQPETVNRLLDALADGLTIKQACIAAGIGETTLSRWKDGYPELETQLVEAREHARQKALAGIKDAAEKGEWRAWAKFLELSFPEYRQPSTRIEVNNRQAQGGLTVICTEEQRQAMIAAREQFLKDGSKSPPLPDQPKLQPGHIGATRVPGDGEQSDTEQTIVQPGQAFTPYFEPHGVDVAASEAELYGWTVKK